LATVVVARWEKSFRNEEWMQEEADSSRHRQACDRELNHSPALFGVAPTGCSAGTMFARTARMEVMSMMKYAVAITAFLLLAGCASNAQNSGDADKLQVQLAQVDTPGSSNLYYFAGPINVRYQLAITNPTKRHL